MVPMKSCLGCLVLVIALGAVVITVAYHASVNSELRFEPRDSHVEYINTRRSYRPPKVQPQGQQAAPAQMEDDDVAEEVEP